MSSISRIFVRTGQRTRSEFPLGHTDRRCVYCQAERDVIGASGNGGCDGNTSWDYRSSAAVAGRNVQRTLPRIEPFRRRPSLVRSEPANPARWHRPRPQPLCTQLASVKPTERSYRIAVRASDVPTECTKCISFARGCVRDRIRKQRFADCGGDVGMRGRNDDNRFLTCQPKVHEEGVSSVSSARTLQRT